MDNQRLRAVVQVAQHAVGRVRAGMAARVSLVGQPAVPGAVTFVSPLADAATRTFRVEIAVPNPERALPSGVSAEVVIPTETVPAHRVSPAMVSLDAAERVGLHSVDGEGIARFHPIQLVRAEAEAIWIAGLSERLRLITIRPGFVAEGQPVEARETPEGYGQPAASRGGLPAGQRGPARCVVTAAAPAREQRRLVLGEVLDRTGRAGHGLLLPAARPARRAAGGGRLLSGARRAWLPAQVTCPRRSGPPVM